MVIDYLQLEPKVIDVRARELTVENRDDLVAWVTDLLGTGYAAKHTQHDMMYCDAEYMYSDYPRVAGVGDYIVVDVARARVHVYTLEEIQQEFNIEQTQTTTGQSE